MSLVSSVRKPNTTSSDYNSLNFAIWQQLAQVNTLEIGVVVAVNSDKTLDFKPLLNTLTPDSKTIEQDIIYNLPYLRIQAGKNAFRITPQIGDIGLVGYCQRDISGIISTKKQANPQSNRRFSNSDGVYISSVASLMSEPVRFMEINDGQMVITGDVPLNITATQATVNAPTTINGDTKINGNVSVTGAISATQNITTDAEITASVDVKAGIISLLSHKHAGVTPGNGTTGVPQ